MRRDIDVREIPERARRLEGFGIENVEDSGGERVLAHDAREFDFVDEGAARDVDEDGVARDRGEGGGVDQMMRFGGRWGRDDDRIRLREELVEAVRREELVDVFGCVAGARASFEADRATAEGAGAGGDGLADAPESDDADC